ncbi:hypothetical protein EJ05DRAFT_499840 [Pseudovirgaria hyperparasitica]|uniref:Zn(2)-C6 fungal-type domain-containing protein n=1 Tax=Pseudovirgaria hyperparasitica TaxID=470096 RepID=A0A6A6W6R3_9PEZI|nr:uncharacterized protein EJ05DRAFT_499840 [Pseudovirgaria hyperparasitica]KAF2758313.1 hypothetical protein EJ05DRAFT_499840 [Pseudovirgaria hyperparasitica]
MRAAHEDNRKRVKTWKPKTKTGCRTCRVRRIKCDEAKPFCRRCVSTGRQCDGYEVQDALTRKSSSASPVRLLIEDPSLLIGTAEEREFFHFFQVHTACEFTGFFDSSVFVNGTLQASQFRPEIRHALTALGAMHQKFLSGHTTVVPDDPSDLQIRFALQQCNQSLTHIRQQTVVKAEIETMLTLCMLYFSFACLQGHQATGLAHLRHALYMLAEMQTGQSPSFESHPLTVGSIRGAFIGLDSMARALLPDVNLKDWITLPGAAVNPQEPPEIFHSLAEAEACSEANFNGLLSSLQEISHTPPSQELVRLAIDKHKDFSARFRKFGLALESYVDKELHNLDFRQKKTVSMLRLYRSIASSTLAILSQSPMYGEVAWDNVVPSFTSIVDCAARILGETCVDELAATVFCTPGIREQYPNECDEYCAEARRIMDISKRPPSFSCRFGVVFPLYLVAARCREPLLRRKALGLMLHYPRREGLWDGVLAARLAFECMCLEEDAVPGPVTCAKDIPEECRIKGVAIHYTGPRQAEAEMRTTAEHKLNKPGVKRFVTW